MSKALLLQEATSQQEQRSKVLPTAVLTPLDSTEPPSSYRDRQPKGRLSSAPSCNSLSAWAASEAKCLPSCVPCISKEQWQHLEPELPPQSTPKLGELSSEVAPSQRDLKTDICPGKRRHDRCFVDLLTAPSYIFESPISFPCWDPHQKLSCEEAAAARDCTDVWQNSQLQGKDGKTRRKCRHRTIDTCNVPSLCFAQQQFSSLVLL